MGSDIWFHRYHTNDKGKLVDVEGKCKTPTMYSEVVGLTVSTVDYNSWIESDKGLRLAASLDKDTVLAEGTVSMGARRKHPFLLMVRNRLRGVRHRKDVSRQTRPLGEKQR